MLLHVRLNCIVLAGLLASLTACGSSNSNVDELNANAGNSQADGLPALTVPIVDEHSQSDPAGIIDTGTSPDSIDTNPNENDTANTDPDNTANPNPDDTANTDPDDTANTDPDNTAETELGMPPSIELLIPAVKSGTDLDRLIRSMTRQAAITLLDLNRRFAQGEDFSSLQEKCLGAYEPGLGNLLFEINCAQDPTTEDETDSTPAYLATGNIPVYVGQAAFYRTAECEAALANQGSEGCFLKQISLLMKTQFQVPDGASRPLPVFAGANLAYAVGDTSLRISNLPSALTGAFGCDINLETMSQSDMINTGSCTDTIKAMADQLELLHSTYSKSALPVQFELSTRK